MEIRTENASESLKSMLVEKIIACHANQKVLLKIQNHQNWPHQFFRIENSPSVMLPVFAFFGQKMSFLISRTSV